MIQLKEINESNFRDCIRLNVNENQKTFVATNVYSIAQAYIHYGSAFPYGIYQDDKMVGFVMLGHNKEDQEFWLWRFMIDEKFQDQGIGTKAVQLALEKFKEMGATEIYLSYEPENHIADALYRKFGWLPTGKVEEGEIVMLLTLDKEENHV
ncbi:MAG: GNAT family N-acetyltransferase [Firmicutes bacterium HGW-Firmicutes-19]|jgi:diamine N-acetyltransferase|nr:MAG: GNAT family N-acetyltransferase [Firmicutes bacterium HGW-Firmicutes-19]